MDGPDESSDGPCLSPPFYTLDLVGMGRQIIDSEGRTLLVENRHGGFVDELCEVMNENKERLVEAWSRRSRRT